MNSLTLRIVVNELNSHRGARVEGVTQPDDWEIRIRLGRDLEVVVAVHPAHNTLYIGALTDSKGETSSALPFGKRLTRDLVRSRFVGANQAGLDRVVSLEFQKLDRLGDPQAIFLYAEFMGNRTNLFLVEGPQLWTGRVLDHIRKRRLPTGSNYSRPRTEKTDITEAAPEALLQSLGVALKQRGSEPGALVQAWSGVSPSIAREIWRLAGPEHDPKALLSAWSALVQPPVATEVSARPKAVVVRLPNGNEEVLPFLKVEDSELEFTGSFPTVSEALAAVHTNFKRTLESRRHAPFRDAIRSATRRVDRALNAMDKEDVTPEDFRRTAEALLALPFEIPRGTSTTEIPDPETGATLTVRLNPRFSASQNADLFFKRARKAERREARAGQRREELVTRKEALEKLARELSDAGPEGPDSTWHRKARELGIQFQGGAPDPNARPEDRLPSALRPRRYDLGQGWEALVGKSNRGNDVLTHEMAKPHEIWMHADQAAGSHLVLRHHEKEKQPSRSVLLAAAAIAAYFSKARNAAKVPVVISKKRHVRRPRKSPMGTASVGEHETVMVKPALLAGSKGS